MKLLSTAIKGTAVVGGVLATGVAGFAIIAAILWNSKAFNNTDTAKKSKLAKAKKKLIFMPNGDAS